VQETGRAQRCLRRRRQIRLKKTSQGVNWNFGAPQLYEHSLAAGEAVLSFRGWRPVRGTTGVFTGRSPQRQVHRSRTPLTDKSMWWAGNQSITVGTIRSALRRFRWALPKAMTLFRAGSLRGGADSNPQGQDPRLYHRTCLAFTVHPHAV